MSAHLDVYELTHPEFWFTLKIGQILRDAYRNRKWTKEW